MFQNTCGTPGDVEASFTLDEMLDDIMLYWLPNAGASSARIYWELSRAGGPPGPIQLPTGFTMLAKEAVRKSRRWVERRYANVVHGPRERHSRHPRCATLIDAEKSK
jgi:hypothetical protein